MAIELVYVTLNDVCDVIPLFINTNIIILFYVKNFNHDAIPIFSNYIPRAFTCLAIQGTGPLGVRI